MGLFRLAAVLLVTFLLTGCGEEVQDESLLKYKSLTEASSAWNRHHQELQSLKSASDYNGIKSNYGAWFDIGYALNHFQFDWHNNQAKVSDHFTAVRL